MTILIIILLTLLAIIIIAGVLAVIYAPMRISLRFNQETAIEIEFGRYMAHVWTSIDWFSITKLYYNKHDEVINAHFIFSCFRANKKQVDKLNTHSNIEYLDGHEFDSEYDDICKTEFERDKLKGWKGEF